jgi:glycosyltransferase involved in cell wall biosynthesis
MQLRMLIEKLVTLDAFDIHYVARNVDPRHEPQGYHIHRVPARHTIGATYLLDLPGLHHILEHIAPDVIYQRVGCAYSGGAAAYAVKRQRKMVWHIASDRDLLPVPWRLSIRTVFEQMNRRVIDYAARHAQCIVVQNEQQRALLRQRFGRDDAVHIPNFHPEPGVLGAKPAHPVRVCWISNIKPLKQLQHFVYLARDFRERPNVEFVVVGAQQMVGAEWQKLLNDMQTTPNLRYLGEQPLAAVESLLASSHVLVNTSTVEGFPNTFIQAWLREVPVISLSVNPDRILDDPRYGFAAGGDYDKMRAAVDRLISDAALRADMGSAARQMALERFSYRNRDRLIALLTP